MPLTHTRTFRVRYYECDALGRLSSSNYLRYMQETALDASAAAGYGLDYYETLNRYWLVRQTRINYFLPLFYNESVHVKTWVATFGRVRSRRAYEFHHVETGQPVAQASTDWVFVDGSSGRPVSPSQKLKEAFFPEGLPEPSHVQEEFPALPPAPAAAFQTPRQASWQHLDPMGHVNNAVYLAYMEDAAIAAMAASGWPAERLRAEGCWPAARQQQIEYRQPAVLGEKLQVITWLRLGPKMAWTRFAMASRLSDGSLLAQAQTEGVFVEPVTNRLVQPPEAILAALSGPPDKEME